MVGNTGLKQKKLGDILSEKQVNCVVRKLLGGGKEWRVVRSEVKAAADGLSGFLGDHLRVTLEVAGDSTKTLHLFIKRLPYDNQAKVDFIAENNFFKKEALVGRLLDLLQSDNDPHPWCAKTLISTDTMIVMPDMRPLGYTVRSQRDTLDVPHLLCAAASVARFHAASANYETKKRLQTNKPWTFSQEYGEEIFKDHQFKASNDAQWMRASAKLTANVLKAFSKKYSDTTDLEEKIMNKFIQACKPFHEYDNTLNVLLHKDLWITNIMFRYENGEPVNTLLVDYQCLRYGPPAFDLMILLYCTTTRSFREQHGMSVLRHYYSVFYENVEDATKQRLVKLGYDEKKFLEWCDTARMFGATQAAGFYPMILMDPMTAQKIFDNPETFHEVFMKDRTKPVLENCSKDALYKERLLEISEEFAERYLESLNIHIFAKRLLYCIYLMNTLMGILSRCQTYKMVGAEVVQTQYKLEDVLTEKQVHCIVEQLLKSGLNWRIVGSEVKPASIESSGFVGEYFVVKLHVRAVEASETLHLFVKRVPVKNQPKAEFINCNHFYKREDMVYQLINELSVVDDPLPWCTRGLVHNEFLLVMVDLCSLGYSPRPQTETLDLAHVLTTISSVARFHAATANYETRKTQENSSPWTMSQAYGEILAEANFKDTPWMNCAVKLTANLLKTFSNKYKNIANLETKLNKLFFEACDELKEYEDTLNVLVHKDLWINNIMFRYEEDVPVNALLIDYQCLRYGPPTFDIMMFLYLTTSKAFREKYEQMVFQRYYSILMNNVDKETKLRLDRLNYDEKEFLRWCERSRKFGAMAAIAIFPYILMDPVEAKKTFDDPDTYTEHLAVDRSKPVIAHCLQNPMYRDRQVEVCEEFVERFVEK
ncbi:uncharacterized protein LOC106142316 [Amyelois transitella]|uniref:uncharacterized protein LOC106142316 n=1 Tax=Amyelois transitella TaxID=680683 RepID=UPI00299046A5|nr:uncharacterized protein LOC106142316 [Amyelois transitella]